MQSRGKMKNKRVYIVIFVLILYTHLILKSFDSLLKLSGELNGNAINRLIELYSSNIKNIEGNNQKVYYNNELNHDSNISGITFTVYDQYSTEENEILFYVYNE